VEGQSGQNLAHGQPDDIVQGAFHAGDATSAIRLGGVGSGFVQGVNGFQVAMDGFSVEVTKLDPAGGDELTKKRSQPRRGLAEANSCENFVDASTQATQHGARFVHVARFAQNFALQDDYRIRPQNDPTGVSAGHGEGFAVRIGQDESGGSFRVRGFFLLTGINGGEIHPRRPQKIGAAR
jgi:hypothetical protein